MRLDNIDEGPDPPGIKSNFMPEDPSALRYRDEGREMLQPKSGAPLYRMEDGRFLL